MSEVKRYDVLHSSIGGVDEVESECGEYVRADDALSRIAVLREELERVQKISDNYYALTVEANQRLADAERRNAELEAVDPSKENKMFEAWAKTQSSVSLRLCDIGLYLSRETGLAHDAWQARAALKKPEEAKS